MRIKMFSTIIIAIFVTGLTLPFLLQSQSPTFESVTPNHSSIASDATHSWHHDCSNTSGLIRNNTWQTQWLSNNWVITDGDIISSGNYLYFSGIPVAYDPIKYHGPVFVHEFEQSFQLNQLRNFTVKLEIDNSQSSYAGKIFVALTDSEYRPVLTAYAGDGYDSLNRGHIFSQYTTLDGEYYRGGMTDVDDFTGFDGVILFNNYLDYPISSYVYGYPLEDLISPYANEMLRNITHLVIITGRLATYTYMPCKIHDIFVGWDSEPAKMYINHPQDREIIMDVNGHEIIWTPYAENPESFELYRDEELIDSGSWSGSNFTVSLDELPVGTYVYKLVVFNSSSISIEDEVTVTVVEPPSTGPAPVWHDDCSNVSDWISFGFWEGPTVYATADGELSSTGTQIHCPTNYGYASGPFWFKELNNSLTLYEFESWTIKIKATQPSMSYKGAFVTCLFDENMEIVFTILLYSWNELEHKLDIRASYSPTAGPSRTYLRPSTSNPNFDDTICIYYESGVGLIGSIGNEGGGILASESDWIQESTRVIRYIGVQWRKGTGIYLDYFLDDIQINGEYQPAVIIIDDTGTTSTITSTTTSTNETTTISDILQNLAFSLSIGAVGFIIIVFLVIVKTKGGSSSSTGSDYRW